MRRSPLALVLAAIAASRVAVAAAPDTAAPAATTASGDTAAAAAPAPAPSPDGAPPPDDLATLLAPPGPTYNFVGSFFVGDGLRFNNPYRLATQLGESARTVSVTTPYVDFGIALGVGDAFGLRHGAALNLSVALSGVGQAVLAPTYFVSYRGGSQRFLGFGRLGPVIVLSPDANAGGELGLGGAVFLTAKSALSAELVADLVYGAATREAGYPVYPVLSLQVGLLLDHEVLP